MTISQLTDILLDIKIAAEKTDKRDLIEHVKRLREVGLELDNNGDIVNSLRPKRK